MEGFKRCRERGGGARMLILRFSWAHGPPDPGKAEDWHEATVPSPLRCLSPLRRRRQRKRERGPHANPPLFLGPVAREPKKNGRLACGQPPFPPLSSPPCLRTGTEKRRQERGRGPHGNPPLFLGTGRPPAKPAD